MLTADDESEFKIGEVRNSKEISPYVGTISFFFVISQNVII